MHGDGAIFGADGQTSSPQSNLNGGGIATFYHPPTLINGEMVFDVFALGTRGAGKTLFLSALYHQLSVLDRNSNNFFIELCSEQPNKAAKQRTFLVRTYDQATNPEASWPPGNATINEYDFACRYHAAGKTTPLFRFRYLDYPGGYLTGDVDGPEDLDIPKQTQKAHSILVLIDGQKVLAALEGLPMVGPSLHAEINITIPFLQSCADRPIQFIVTKWDILDGHHSLKEVRDELLKNENFRKYVEQRIAQRLPVHLIPVSALGNDFAEFDRAENKMRKKKDGRVQPYNIDLCLGMVLTDHLLLLANRREYQTFHVYGMYLLRMLKWLIKGVEETAKVLTLPDAISFVRTERILQLLGSAQKNLIESEQGLRQQIEDTVKEIKNQKSAIQAILMIQAMRRNWFYGRFPDADLTTRAM